MQAATSVNPIDAGNRALAVGQWGAARAAFELALAGAESADALAGLGLARWWLRDGDGALDARTRAYAVLLREQRFGEAARMAVWLAREHRARESAAVADGWLARARSAADAAGDPASHGWLALGEADAAGLDARIGRLSVAAAQARAVGDADLEILALARLGVAEVSAGQVESGLAHADEAMAAATAGEGLDAQSVGEACCALMEVAGLLGDFERVRTWSRPIEQFQAAHGFPQLTALGVTGQSPDVLAAFCGTCCGGFQLVSGRLDDAEASLVDAMAELRESGMASRCVHPASQLAELRLAQGRYEEAEALLAEFADRPECAQPMAALELARGSATHAASRLRHAIADADDDRVGALPLLTLLVDAELARGATDGAGETAAAIAEVADLTDSRWHRAHAAFALAKVAAARGESTAAAMLRDACVLLSDAQAALDACRARLAYARALVDEDEPVAITEARAALVALDRLGATVDADAAANFLRERGVRGRTGDKGVAVLSTREQQVLRLVAAGLTNREIAERLRISVKTAGHHVSNILTKLGLRSRTEAAAWAVLHSTSAD